MENKFDISEFVKVNTRQEILTSLVEREKARRKQLKLSQKELATKSGVSYASLRRFEREGEISLAALMKIALALNCLDDFENLFCEKIPDNIDDIKL